MQVVVVVAVLSIQSKKYYQFNASVKYCWIYATNTTYVGVLVVVVVVAVVVVVVVVVVVIVVVVVDVVVVA